MSILKHILIALLIFTSTILSSNPAIFCKMAFDKKICEVKVVNRTKGCCSKNKEKSEKTIEQVCSLSKKSPTCDLSKKEKVKKCYSCFYSKPIKDAVLSELSVSNPPNLEIQFNNIDFSSSTEYYRNYLTTSIPIGIHNTISSTIMLL